MAEIFNNTDNNFQHISVPFNYRRGNPAPLDDDEVWTTLAAAQEYARTSPVAYVGQVLAVADGTTAKCYIIRNQNGDLQELGQGGDSLVEVTYNQLKELRNEELLVPGQQYKIVDYVATTNKDADFATVRKAMSKHMAFKLAVNNDETKPDSIYIESVQYKSANKPFCVIVVADTQWSLNENARCCKPDVDAEHVDLFEGCILEAWEIKYCLDNDKTRFAWADEDNGKGVIYWMRDEYDNEAGYDFKGITFLPYGIDGIVPEYYTFSFVQQTYTLADENDPNSYSVDLTIFDDTGKLIHGLTDDPANRPRGNKIEKFVDSDGKQYINGIAFLRIPDYEDPSSGELNAIQFTPSGATYNTFDSNCALITAVGGRAKYNTFGKFCSNILLNVPYDNYYEDDAPYDRYDIGRNVFGLGCQYIVLDAGCFDNTIGAVSKYIAFDYDCRNNKIGAECNDIRLHSGSTYNIIEDVVNVCEFGRNSEYINIKSCNHDIFTGYGCKSIQIAAHTNPYSDEIRLGDECARVQIGSEAYVIRIGSYSWDINIGNNCKNCTIGEDCSSINIGHNCGGYNDNDISIADKCAKIDIGDQCLVIQIPERCSHITINKSCENIKLLKPKFNSVIIEQNNKGIYLDSNANESVYTKNVEVKQATNHWSTTEQALTLLVDDVNGNQTYLTTFANSRNVTHEVTVL